MKSILFGMMIVLAVVSQVTPDAKKQELGHFDDLMRTLLKRVTEEEYSDLKRVFDILKLVGSEL